MANWREMTMDQQEVHMKGGGRFTNGNGMFVAWSDVYQQYVLTTVGAGGNLTPKLGDLQRLMEQYNPDFTAWRTEE